MWNIKQLLSFKHYLFWSKILMNCWCFYTIHITINKTTTSKWPSLILGGLKYGLAKNLYPCNTQNWKFRNMEALIYFNILNTLIFKPLQVRLFKYSGLSPPLRLYSDFLHTFGLYVLEEPGCFKNNDFCDGVLNNGLKIAPVPKHT